MVRVAIQARARRRTANRERPRSRHHDRGRNHPARLGRDRHHSTPVKSATWTSRIFDRIEPAFPRGADRPTLPEDLLLHLPVEDGAHVLDSLRQRERTERKGLHVAKGAAHGLGGSVVDPEAAHSRRRRHLRGKRVLELAEGSIATVFDWAFNPALGPSRTVEPRPLEFGVVLGHRRVKVHTLGCVSQLHLVEDPRVASANLYDDAVLGSALVDVAIVDRDGHGRRHGHDHLKATRQHAKRTRTTRVHLRILVPECDRVIRQNEARFVDDEELHGHIEHSELKWPCGVEDVPHRVVQLDDDVVEVLKGLGSLLLEARVLPQPALGGTIDDLLRLVGGRCCPMGLVVDELAKDMEWVLFEHRMSGRVGKRANTIRSVETDKVSDCRPTKNRGDLRLGLRERVLHLARAAVEVVARALSAHARPLVKLAASENERRDGVAPGREVPEHELRHVVMPFLFRRPAHVATIAACYDIDAREPGRAMARQLTA